MKFGDKVKHRYLVSPEMMVLSGAGNGKGVVCRYWNPEKFKFETIELLEKELEISK